jgi:hypothetical protein
MNAEVLRKYWVELAIAALAVIALLVGLVLTHHGQASPDSAASGASATSDTAASTSTTGTADKSLPVLAGGTNYYIDRIQHGAKLEHYTPGKPVTFTMAPGETLSLVGWSYDAKAAAPATGVVAQVDEFSRTDATYGEKRTDVASVFKNPNLTNVGFVINIPASALPPGKHTVSLLTENAAQNGYYPQRNVMIVTVGK